MSEQVATKLVGFDDWLARVVKLYPQIERAYLVGSRAVDRHRPNSDYDVVVCLQDSCYRTIREGYRVEQAITFDLRLTPNPVDLFFAHEDDMGFVHFTRWVFGDRDGLVDGGMDGDLSLQGLADFDRSLDTRRILYGVEK